MSLHEAMATLQTPKWEEIPDLYLYMDQVTSVLGKHLAPFSLNDGEHPITSTMVNNYVKQRLIPPPEKKRYGREHLALLYICALLKQVLSLSELDTLLRLMHENADTKTVYQCFCAELERAAHAVFGKEAMHASSEQTQATLFRTAASAFAYQLYSREMLKQMAEETARKAKEEKNKESKEDKHSASDAQMQSTEIAE